MRVLVLPVLSAVPKPDRVDAVVSGVTAAGLFEVGPVRHALGDEAAAHDDARRAALADAKRQAQVYADAAGLRLEAVDRVVDGGAGESGKVFVPRALMAGASDVGIVPPKTIPFGASVTVTWRVAPP